MSRFASIVKDAPAAAAVHVTTAMGNSGKKRRFHLALGEGTKIISKRDLKPHDDKTAKTPFLYDANALGDIRPDQVPRFFGALTDADKLPDKTVKLSDLVAMQDRVDPAKVRAIGDSGDDQTKLPVVVGMGGKHYIADGHHRLAAQWLAGEDEAKVKFKDLEPVSNALKRDPDPVNFKIAKVDKKLGMVFGWAVVCKVDGQDYYDRNIDQAGTHEGQRVPEHVTEDAMVKCAVDFVKDGAKANEMHEGPDVGTYPFVFPMSTDIAEAMGVTTQKTGLMVALKAPPDVVAKFESGEYTGFSIEGKRLRFEEHE